MTTAIDLGDVTKGEPGSLLLTPEGGDGPATPVVAGLQVTRGKGSDQETAFIPATGAIERSATATDNRAKGSTLSLVAPGATAKVRITASAGASTAAARSARPTRSRAAPPRLWSRRARPRAGARTR